MNKQPIPSFVIDYIDSEIKFLDPQAKAPAFGAITSLQQPDFKAGYLKALADVRDHFVDLNALVAMQTELIDD